MKYKVGDKVRIKSLDWYNENRNDDWGTVVLPHGNFYPAMARYCGEILTITGIHKNEIYITKEGGSFNWTDEMIEGLVEEETKPKFKVGDRVITNKGYVGKFESWVSDYQVRVFFEESGDNVVIHPKNLKLVEEEIDINKWTGLKVELELSKSVIGVSNVESLHGERFMSGFVKAIIPPEGYQFKDENGNVINATKIVLEKKKKSYPKTYEECLKILGYDDRETYCIFHTGADERLFEALYRLKVCRDAYWKIAGEEKELGKPWEPNWKNYEQFKYIIICRRGCIIKDTYTAKDVILSFPTPEMRDAFKENFDPDIEICKEFL